MLQMDEMPKLEVIYQRFNEDYQQLIAKHEIKLPALHNPGGVMSSDMIPREQPMESYWRLAVYASQPSSMIISVGDLDHWNPPQRNMTQRETMGGLFVFAMIVLFGVPGLVFAVLHIIHLKRVTPRNGLIIAATTIFLWPALYTIACIPLFIISCITVAKHNISSNDHYIALFFVVIGTIGISAGIYFLRWYLRK